MFYKNDNFEILTPSGFKEFAGVQEVIKCGKIELTLNNGNRLICASKHNILTDNGWIESGKLRRDSKVITKDGLVGLYHIELLDGEHTFYDIVGVPNFEYYTNGIVSHNCEFLGSANTLIHPSKLRTLAWKKPIKQNHLGLKEYYEPDPNTVYAMVVDTARGAGADYSAFIVINVSTFPYKVAAVFKNNTISPLILPNIIFETAKYYNNALVLVETNDIGQQVADILHYDLEYEGMLVSAMSGRNGQSLSGGFATSTHKGVRTTKQVKRIGCSTLKTLVESDKFIIEDADIIYELTRFVLKGQSYEAEDGNDDLAMCCVLFGWLSTQSYLREITDLDVRKKIYEQNERMLEDEMLPFGIFASGDDELDEIINDTPTVLDRRNRDEFGGLMGGVSIE